MAKTGGNRAGATTSGDRREQAARDIRDLHDRGRQIYREIHRDPRQPADERAAFGGWAEELRWPRARVRKACRLADPARGFTAREIVKLCADVRRTPGGRPVFGPSHFLRLASVPRKRERVRLLEAALAGGWSYRRLELEVARRYGARTHGGRHRRIPADRAGLYAQLEGMCHSWRRWAAALGPTDGGRGRVRLADLPLRLRHGVHTVTTAARALQAAVRRELGRLSPGRQPR